MVSIALMLLACNPVHRIKTPEVHRPSQIGSVEARMHILTAYHAQYNEEPTRSMEEFHQARRNDPGSPVILLLWGDSAWEQGLHDEARLAWEQYRDSLTDDSPEEQHSIDERLQRSEATK